MTLLDFNAVIDEPETGAEGVSEPQPSSKPPKGGVPESNEQTEQDSYDDIIDVLMPPSDEAEPEVETEKKAATTEETPPVKTIHHDPKLVQLASSWGISPNEAAQYPTDESLLGAVRAREMRVERLAAERGKHREEETKEDDLPLPEFQLDEEVDPKIKTAIQQLTGYAAKLKERADRQFGEMREKLALTEQQQAAIAESRLAETNARIADLIDEETKSWGADFEELLGVPSKTFQPGKEGTPQFAEVQKLRDRVELLAFGYQQLRGRWPDPKQIVEFWRQERDALWPDMTKKAVRREISNGLKKQKGGIGLRSAKARDVEPLLQGDEYAKRDIADYLTSIGANPWAKRSA